MFAFVISTKSKLVKPHVKSFALSRDLSFLVLKPLPTAINRLPFLSTDDAIEFQEAADKIQEVLA